jgi:undecaprenyl diphosphate synthase
MNSNALNHLAIIMDGNGRWAKGRNLPKMEGHKVGAEVARKMIEFSLKEGIKHLSLYTFSSENWNRPILEVNSLMGLLEYYINREAKSLNENGVKVIFIGDLNRLNPRLQTLINDIMQLTLNNNKLILYIALSYGGRQELVNACKKLISQSLNENDINENILRKNLYVHDMPDVDLLIRTSGEQRISNFLLWQLAYSELYFTEKYWPDFSEHDLKLAIAEYKQRIRNFGHSRDIK